MLGLGSIRPIVGAGLPAKKTLPVPRLPAVYLSRVRLLHALHRAQPRLRLLCAPAGYGKTALLCEFLQHMPGADSIVWLSFAGRRQSTTGLRSALALELGLAVDIDPHVLLGILEAYPAPLWLVLDDLPYDLPEELNQWLEQLLALPTCQVQLLVSCRRRPDWNLPRLMLTDDLLELDASALALSRSEFDALAKRLRPDTDGPSLDVLWQEVGSWCAGVRLLLDASVNCSALNSTLLREYLKHEVLSRLGDEQCEVLYGLAQLPKVNASLCDLLWEGQGGAQLFTNLLQSQAFLIPIDGQPHWYRLLPAVARGLEDRLGGPALNHLRLRYCRLMSAGGHFDVAIEQALLAEQPEVAASYMQRLRLSWLINDRHLNLFIAWREQVPAYLLDSSPRLICLCAWALMFRGRLEESSECLQQLERYLPQPDPNHNQRLLANWQALYGTLQAMRGNGDLARQHCRAALNELTQQDWLCALLCHSTLARVCMIGGDLLEARHLLEEAVKLARRQGSLAGEVLINTDRFRLMSLQGELALAETLVQEDLKRLRAETSVQNPLLGRVLALRGELLVAQDRLEEGEHALLIGMQHVEGSYAPFVLHGYFVRIEIALRRDCLEQAQVLLHEAQRRMHCSNIDGDCYQSAIALLKMRILAHQGHWVEVLPIAHALEEHLQGPRPSLPPLQLPSLAQRNQLLLAQAEFKVGDSELAQRRLRTLLQQCERLGFEQITEEVCKVLMTYQRKQSLQALVRAGSPPAQASACSSGHPLASPVSSCQDDLTPREISVLKLLAEGMSVREVGESLFISVNTVKTHAKNINVKLGAVRRTQAINCAKAMGILA